MGNGRLSNRSWTRLVLDAQQRVVEVINPDDKLFFGLRPQRGMTLAEAAGEANRRQAEIIAEGVARAQREKRDTCFEYFSSGDHTPGGYVCAHGEYLPDGSLCLWLTSLDSPASLDTPDSTATPDSAVPNAFATPDSSSTPIQELGGVSQSVYDCLPVGIEIYDCRGRLIEVNAYDLKMLGVETKNDLLGMSLFHNPHFDREAIAGLRAGQHLHLTVDYDFARVGSYYKTSKRSVSHLEFAIYAMSDGAGQIDKYLVVVHDLTELSLLQDRYARLYEQNRTILNVLPVGVGLFCAKEGTLLYYNDAFCRIFGIDRQCLSAHSTNLYETPALLPETREAIRRGEPIHAHFPYDFSEAIEKGCLDSTIVLPTDLLREIECTGQPVFDRDGCLDNYVFAINDITETVSNEKLLKQSKHKSELAMQAADIMLWELDVQKGLFFSDNEPLNDYDNTTPVTPATYTDTVHPEDRDRVRESIVRMCAGEDFSFQINARVRLPGIAEWQYCTITGAPYERDADGKIVKYVGVRKNDTELQRKKLLQGNILDSIPMAIHIKDVEDGFRYVFCNEESKKMFGTTESNALDDILDTEGVDLIRKTDLEVFNTGKPYLGLERIALKDGRSYEVIARKSIIYDNGKRLLLSVRWDQSMQNELQRRAKLLSVTLEMMNAFTWFYEPDKLRINFGDGFDKVGRKASDVNSLDKFAACVHPDDRQRFLDSLDQVVARESGFWDVQCRFDLDGDGVYSWWEVRGILETSILNNTPYKYMFGMTISIESHKQAELTLLKNREEMIYLIRQNELVLNNTNAGLAYISPDYVVQWENISKCSASITYEAYREGECCYKTAHNRTEPCENCVLQRAFASRQVEQIKFSFDNGHTVEIFATPVVGADDEVEGVVIRVDDITERERMFQELTEAKALAEQSDKLKSAFLANMSHEIRTPLNAIVGFSELLMESPEEERGEFMQIIKNNNDLLLKLINDILDLSKIEAGSVELQYENFDLAGYFDEVAAAMKQRLIGSAVRLVVANPYRSCRVRLDRNRIAQIMINYVTNAIKYTPSGLIEMGYSCTDTGIRFSVRDTGIGIPDEKKVRVFHRFAKLDEFAQGTGLGLSICKAIAESMGGSVGFESSVGKGSLFWVELPCEPEIGGPDPQQSGALTPQGAHSGGPMAGAVSGTDAGVTPSRKRILVAEDIPSNYLLVSTMLEKKFDMVQAHNGLEAVEMAREGHYDLLLMDMKMPQMDGLTATAEIRKFNTELPIVALTAHAFEADRLAALAAGCNDFMVKPVSKAQLLAMARKFCPGPEDMVGGA